MKTLLTITPFYAPNLGGVETHLHDLTHLIEKETNLHHVVATYTPLTAPVDAPFRGTHHRKPHKSLWDAPRQEPLKNGVIFRMPWPGGRWFYRFEPFPPLQLAYLMPGLFFLSLRLAFRFRSSLAAIHGHGLTALVIAACLKKIFPVRSFVSLHTIYKFSSRPGIAWAVRWLSRHIDQYFTLSEDCRKDLIDIGVPPEKIVTYTNWVDNETTFVTQDQTPCRLQLQLPQEGFWILFMARLSKEKGVELVLNVIEKMKDVPCIFLLVGDGPLKEEVARRTAGNPRVFRFGPARPEQLPTLYNASDVLLMGSADGDCFGRVTMEALSCGRPVILPSFTSYFNIRQPLTVTLPDPRVGVIVEPTPEKMAELLTDMAKRQALMPSLPAREFALAHFGHSQAAPFLKAYRSL